MLRRQQKNAGALLEGKAPASVSDNCYDPDRTGPPSPGPVHAFAQHVFVSQEKLSHPVLSPRAFDRICLSQFIAAIPAVQLVRYCDRSASISKDRNSRTNKSAAGSAVEYSTSSPTGTSFCNGVISDSKLKPKKRNVLIKIGNAKLLYFTTKDIYVCFWLTTLEV